MRSIPADVLARLNRGEIVLHGAHRIETADPEAPMCSWSGIGDLTINDEVYRGLMAPDMVAPITYEIGQGANGIDVTLSSVGSDLVPLVLQQDLRGRDIDVMALYFDHIGTTLLHVETEIIGTLDQTPTREIPGGEGVVIFKIESEAMGARRGGGRLASDQDQRTINPTDGSMRYVSTAPEVTMFWGGEPTKRRAGSALNGGQTNVS